MTKFRRPSLASVQSAGAALLAATKSKPPTLHPWPLTADALLTQFEVYAQQRAANPELELMLFGWTVSVEEVDFVPSAQDRFAAAKGSYANRINRLD